MLGSLESPYIVGIVLRVTSHTGSFGETENIDTRAYMCANNDTWACGDEGMYSIRCIGMVDSAVSLILR